MGIYFIYIGGILVGIGILLLFILRTQKMISLPKALPPGEEDMADDLMIRGADKDYEDLVKDLIGDTSTLVASPEHLDRKVREVIDQFNVNQGWFSTFFGEGSSQRKATIAANFTEIESQVINQFLMLADRYREGKVKEINFKHFAYDKANIILEAFSKARRIKEAMELGIPEADYTADKVASYRFTGELGRKRAEKELEHEFKAKDLLLEVSIEQHKLDLRIQEKLEDTLIEWGQLKRERQMDIQTAMLANLPVVGEIEFLTQELFKVLAHIAELDKYPQTPQLEESKQVFIDNKSKLQEAINERFQRLLQTPHRKESQGLEETEQNPQD